MQLRLASLALVLATLALPTLTRAQSLFAFEAPIAPEGQVLGRLSDTPLTVIDWIGPHEVRVRFQDAELRLETPIDLARAHTAGAPHTHVVIGTGRRSSVEVGAWSVTMEAGAWAPLRGFEGDAWRIALPRGMPGEEGLARGMRPLRGAPRRAFDHRVVSQRRFEYACDGQLEIRASADPASSRWPVPAASTFRITPGASPMRVEVRIAGFVVRGFVDALPAPCDGAIGMSGIGSQCGDGASRGLVVRVPRGTPLYASATSTTPFATLRRPTVARERLDREPAMTCEGARCTREPPEPTGAQPLLFDREGDGAADWAFVAVVRVPLESLPRVAGHTGFGHCTSPPTDWR